MNELCYCELYFYYVIFVGLLAVVDARCDGIDLMVNDQPFNQTVLYKPVGSHGIFVKCQKCDDNINRPIWYSLNEQMQKSRLGGCKKSLRMVCSAKLIHQVSYGLSFTSFTPSLAGLYECRISGGFKSIINISVLG